MIPFENELDEIFGNGVLCTDVGHILEVEQSPTNLLPVLEPVLDVTMEIEYQEIEYLNDSYEEPQQINIKSLVGVNNVALVTSHDHKTKMKLFHLSVQKNEDPKKWKILL